MGSEWPRVTLEEIAEVVDSRHKTPIYSDEGLPMVRVVDVKGGQLQLDGTKKVSPEVYDDFSKGRDPQIFDLVISRVGSYGNVAYIDTLDKFCLGQNTALIIPQNKDRFLYHSLRSTQVKAQIEEMVVGAVQKTISLKTIKSLIVPDPPMQQRKNIDIFLSSLDDKIQLNHQTNQTLEQMAQALFKSWFVDFDPVIDNALEAGNTIPDELQDRAERRKQQLAKPDHQALPDDIRQLFPSEFQLTDELGWVPMRWETRELGNLIDVLETGRRPKGGVAKYKSGIPSVGAESIKGIGNFEYGKTKFVPHEFFEKMKSGKVQEYDVLLYKDGGKPGEFKPRIAMFGEGFPFKEYGINEHVFRLRSKKIGQFYLYYQLCSDRVFHDLAVRGGKAAIPGINQKEVKGQLFLVPSKELLEVFNKQVFSFVELMLKNSSSSLTLAKLRDILLPKLISGELRLPSGVLSDAEQQPAAANS